MKHVNSLMMFPSDNFIFPIICPFLICVSTIYVASKLFAILFRLAMQRAEMSSRTFTYSMKMALKHSVARQNLCELVTQFLREIQACLLGMMSSTAASGAKLGITFQSACHIRKILSSASSIRSCWSICLSLALKLGPCLC